MISVVIPSYNRAGVLPMAINSVLGQTYRDIELILVDDGSTDGTEDLIRSIKDGRLRYIKLERNGGACRARNIGIDAAKGEYIAFQDSDDRWHSGKLERQLRFLQEAGVDMVYCAMNRINVNGQSAQKVPWENIVNEVSKSDRYKKLLEKNTMAMVGVLCKAECAREVRFDDALPRWQDWDWALRICQLYEVYYQDEVLVDSFIQSDSISLCYEKHPIAFDLIFEKHKAVIEKDPHLKSLWDCSKANIRFKAGIPDAKSCFIAYRASGDVKLLIKALLCITGLQRIYLTTGKVKGKQ